MVDGVVRGARDLDPGGLRDSRGQIAAGLVQIASCRRIRKLSAFIRSASSAGRRPPAISLSCHLVETFDLAVGIAKTAIAAEMPSAPPGEPTPVREPFKDPVTGNAMPAVARK